MPLSSSSACGSGPVAVPPRRRHRSLCWPSSSHCHSRRSDRLSQGRLALAGPSRHHAAASAAGRGKADGIGVESAPWSLLFDLRERETEWSDGNQGRLVTAFAAKELGVPPEEVAQKLQELCVLVPDLAARIDKLTPALVVSLIHNTKDVARNIVSLKTTFPRADLGKIASAYPQILLEDPKSVQDEASKVAELLGVRELDAIVEEYPRILDAEAVQEALEMLKVIMPAKDPRETLAATPSFISRVERGDRRLGANPDPGSDHSLP